jgi:hypothetical protein
MKQILPACAILFAAALSTLSAQPAKDATIMAALEKQAKTMADEFLKEDFTAFVKYVHPQIVKAMGGKKKVIEALKEGMNAMRAQDVTITKYSVGEPSTVLKVGKELQCTLPQYMEMKSPTNRVELETSLIAISSDNGKKWYFIDTSDKDRETLKSFLPNLSDDLVIQEKKSQVFTE